MFVSNIERIIRVSIRARFEFFTRLSGRSGQSRRGIAAALSSSGLIESCETVPIQRGARIFSFETISRVSILMILQQILHTVEKLK